MRIRTRYVVALVIIIAAVLAAPLGVGFFFKQNYYQMIAARAAGGAPISIVEYNLGWLSSTAKLELSSGKDPRSKITIEQVITHGPIITDPDTKEHKFAEATILSHIHLDRQIETVLLGNANADNGVMGIFTWVSFLQHYNSHFQSASFLIKVPAQPDSKITWSGINGDIETDFKDNYELENFKTSLQGGPLYIQTPEHNVQLSAQQISGEGSCGKDALCVGKSTLFIPLTIVTNPTQAYKLSDFNYLVDSSIDGENFTGKLALGFTKYDAQDYTVGPVDFKIAVNNLNVPALRKLIVTLNDESGKLQQNSDPRVAEMLLMTEMSAQVPHLITPTSSITESSNINTSYGSFTSNMTLSWPEKTPLPANVSDLMQVNFKLHISAATTLVDQIIMSLDQRAADDTVASAILTPAASSITAAATGKPQSFEDLINPLAKQGLTPDEIKNIIALQQKNIPIDAFSSYIDSRVAIRLIPASLAPVLKRDYQTAINTPFQNVAANAGANKQLDVWVRDNKITSETRNSLIQLQKQGLSSEIYNASVDDIVASKRLPADLGEQLKSQYASTNPESSFGGGDTVPAAVPTASSQDQGDGRKKLDAEIQQGFVIQVKDRYVVDINYEHGELKVNGKAVPVPTP